MAMLSDDDLNLADLSDEELDRAWDLWFDLAQVTNDADPPYTHGVFVRVHSIPAVLAASKPEDAALDPGGRRWTSGDHDGSG